MEKTLILGLDLAITTIIDGNKTENAFQCMTARKGLMLNSKLELASNYKVSRNFRFDRTIEICLKIILRLQRH